MMICLILWTYEPLSDEEIIKYWNNLTYNEQIEELRKLDLLEHIPLQFEMFNYIALLDKNNELVIYPEKEKIKIKHVYLIYEIKLPTFYMEDFVIANKKKYLLNGLSGGIIAIFGTLISGEEEWWKYIISGCGGVSIGILTEYLFG